MYEYVGYSPGKYTERSAYKTPRSGMCLGVLKIRSSPRPSETGDHFSYNRRVYRVERRKTD